VPPAATFAPTDVDATSWVKALVSFGARRAVLVVSHGCGFNTFPSRTAFPEFGFEYNYTVAHSPWKNGKGDVAAEFVAACKKYGVRPGFYHNAMNNAYLNVQGGKVRTGRACSFCPDITQDQYTKILLANLRQLWTDYGDLSEVWFDGGFPPNSAEPIAALLKETQPNVVAFQGPGENVIRWPGTESGHPKQPFWSTAKSSLDAGPGSPDGAVFTPGEADTCFQTGAGLGAPYGGCWFYNPGMIPKSLAELVNVYHDIIGSNSFLLLDWTPLPDGTLRSDHIKRYQEFGDWIKGCYSVPVVAVEKPKGTNVTLIIPAGAEVDRIMIEEDQSRGQRARGYKITIGSVVQGTGTSIGNKRIAMLPRSFTGQDINVAVTGEAPILARISAYNCSRVPVVEGCSFQKGFKYKIAAGITISVHHGFSASGCCEACRAVTECAVFVLDASRTCTLLSANQGGAPAMDGSISGFSHSHGLAAATSETVFVV